jgi:6-phosphogluconolactonase
MKVLRKATLVLLVQVLWVALIALPAPAKTFVYVSCADDAEIAILEMNLDNGDLKLIGKAKAGKTVMPMAVSPDRRFLYASIRSVPYSVASYSIDSNKGELTHLSTVPLPDNMAYISTDKTGRFLFAASYTGHKASVNPIGWRGFVQPDPIQVMMTGRNAHAILSDPSNRFVYVPNLGSDQVMQLIFDEKAGILTPNKPAAVYTKFGAGPRHLDFSPNNRFVYVLNELDGTVNAYAFDNQTGLLSEIQSISAVPRDSKLPPGIPAVGIGAPQAPPSVEREEIKCADIHMTPDGRFLYASERTTSTLAAFAVDSGAGKLRYINNFETEKQPRGFQIDPRGNFLIAAGQKTENCSVHRINRATGELQRLKRYLLGKNPNWIEIVDFP